MSNPLAGLGLDYLIGKDGGTVGQAGRIAEVAYDVDGVPSLGPSIAYCNLLDERESYDADTNTGDFGPYLPKTGPKAETAKKYKEGIPDSNQRGFEANLREQFQRRKPFKFVELDNPDAYDRDVAIRATSLAEEYSLGVIAKNPLLIENAAGWLRHPNVYGMIVEKDDDSAAHAMHLLRIAAGKPDLPVWFVSFGQDQLTWARKIAADITAHDYVNMSVTWSSVGEYGNSVIILDPIKSESQPQRPSMAWRLARSLETLRDQVDAKWPVRDKSSDGTIGDVSHQATNSDHNPNSDDVVTAMDVTNDPAHGLVARALAEALVASRDPRIKYIISNAQMVGSAGYEASRKTPATPWVWRPYTGPNAHREHVHISVMADPALYEDARPWKLDRADTPGLPPPAEAALKNGRGSWYSQYRGKYEWVDKGDEPGSAALGVPDDAQGISFYDRSTLGQWFEVHYPNGFVSIEQQSDIGPNPRTGRLIDISAAAAERAGYSPRNFPTDSTFSWRQVSAPSVVAGLSPQQQATRYRDIRTESKPMAEPQIIPPVAGNDALKKIWEQLAPQLMAIVAPYLENAVQALIQKALQDVLKNQPILIPPPASTQQPPVPPVSTQPAPTPTPALQRPSVMASVIGLVLSAATTYFGKGLIPPVLGEAAIATFGGTAAVGATGFFQVIGDAIGKRIAAKYAPK